MSLWLRSGRIVSIADTPSCFSFINASEVARSSIVDRLGPRWGRIAKAAAFEDRLASAKSGDARGLVGFGERIGRFGVDDPAQLFLAGGDDRPRVAVAGKVAGLARVHAEVEKLRRHPGVVHVFVGALADHEGAG